VHGRAGNTVLVTTLVLPLLLLVSRLAAGKSIFPHRGWPAPDLTPQHTELGNSQLILPTPELEMLLVDINMISVSSASE
jgi:hypothetical protein